jgi:hypothetical protein
LRAIEGEISFNGAGHVSRLAVPLHLRNAAKLPIVICHPPSVILNAFLLCAIDHRRHVSISHLRNLWLVLTGPAGVSVAVVIVFPVPIARSGANADPVG